MEHQISVTEEDLKKIIEAGLKQSEIQTVPILTVDRIIYDVGERGDQHDSEYVVKGATIVYTPV